MKRLLIATMFGALAYAPLAAQDPALAAKGKALAVKNHCAMCHVLEGTGGKIGNPLDGVSQRKDDAALRRILTDPGKEFPDAKVKMPKVAWGPGELDAVVAYLKTLKAK